ncbi:MAG TPA: HD domain-containing protein [Patescibacteria group bacterium]|nr:HD domain-containing protein [Patescibacteria group bacterium]
MSHLPLRPQTRFSNYLDPAIPLETRLVQAYAELGIVPEQQEDIERFLGLLKTKRETLPHYEHSIRVAILARRIGKFMHQDEKALFYAGLLHDVGKALTNPATLDKVSGWSEADSIEMLRHVNDSYRLLAGRFDFTAQIVVLHHRFQVNCYPQNIPPSLHEYSEGTKVVILLCARILAIADVFDALHRVNDKTGGAALSGEAIKEKLLAANTDQRRLIEELYESGILTTEIYS